MTLLLAGAYLWMFWQASRLALGAAGQERLGWAGLALLPVNVLILLGLHALTPPELWRDALLEAHPQSRRGSEAWPLRLLLYINLWLPVWLGTPLLKLPELRRPGLAVVGLLWPLWLAAMFLVWRR